MPGRSHQPQIRPLNVKQFLLTPSAGKRLIGKACVAHPAIRAVLEEGALVIIAGTTNGYVAEEVLASIGQEGITGPNGPERLPEQLLISKGSIL